MSEIPSCYCEVDETYEHIAESRPRARKPYKCDECGGSISPGDEYVKHVGFGLGGPTTWRICCGCEIPFEWVRRNCGCWMYADLERHLHEDVFEAQGHLLSPGVKFKVGRWLVQMQRRRLRGEAA